MEQWRLVHLPVNLTANVGSWLNVAWDKEFAAAVIALEDRTDVRGSPRFPRFRGHEPRWTYWTRISRFPAWLDQRDWAFRGCRIT